MENISTTQKLLRKLHLSGDADSGYYRGSSKVCIDFSTSRSSSVSGSRKSWARRPRKSVLMSSSSICSHVCGPLNAIAAFHTSSLPPPPVNPARKSRSPWPLCVRPMMLSKALINTTRYVSTEPNLKQLIYLSKNSGKDLGVYEWCSTKVFKFEN